jgi:hypothetical protein
VKLCSNAQTCSQTGCILRRAFGDWIPHPLNCWHLSRMKANACLCSMTYATTTPTGQLQLHQLYKPPLGGSCCCPQCCPIVCQQHMVGVCAQEAAKVSKLCLPVALQVTVV